MIEVGLSYTIEGTTTVYEAREVDGEKVTLQRLKSNYSRDKVTVYAQASRLREVCGTQVSTGGRGATFHVCGKPVKDEHLCGVHLGAKRRVAANDAKRLAKRTLGEERLTAAKDALREFGLRGSTDYSWTTGEYTGRVTISVEELRLLAATGKGSAS